MLISPHAEKNKFILTVSHAIESMIPLTFQRLRVPNIILLKSSQELFKKEFKCHLFQYLQY